MDNGFIVVYICIHTNFVERLVLIPAFLCLFFLSCKNENKKPATVESLGTLTQDTFLIDPKFSNIQHVVNYTGQEIDYVSRYGKYVIRTGSKDYKYFDFPIKDKEERHYRRLLIFRDTVIAVLTPRRKGDTIKFKYSFNSETDSIFLDLQKYGYSKSAFPGTQLQTPIYFDKRVFFSIGEANPYAKYTPTRQVIFFNLLDNKLDSLNLVTKKHDFPYSTFLTEKHPYLSQMNNMMYVSQPYQKVVYGYDISMNPPIRRDSFLLYDNEKDKFYLETPQNPINMDDDSVEVYLGMIADSLNHKLIKFSFVNQQENGKQVKMHRASIFDLKTRSITRLNLGTGRMRFYVHYFKEGRFAIQDLDDSEQNPGKLIFNVYTYPETK